MSTPLTGFSGQEGKMTPTLPRENIRRFQIQHYTKHHIFTFSPPSPSCPSWSPGTSTAERHTCGEEKLQTAVRAPQGFSQVPIWLTHEQFRPTYKSAIAACFEYLTVSGPQWTKSLDALMKRRENESEKFRSLSRLFRYGNNLMISMLRKSFMNVKLLHKTASHMFHRLMRCLHICSQSALCFRDQHFFDSIR